MHVCSLLFLVELLVGTGCRDTAHEDVDVRVDTDAADDGLAIDAREELALDASDTCGELDTSDTESEHDGASEVVPEVREPPTLVSISPAIVDAVYCTSTRSTTNTSVSFGSMTPPTARLPYARSGGIVSWRRPPTFMPATPWSQPLMT